MATASPVKMSGVVICSADREVRPADQASLDQHPVDLERVLAERGDESRADQDGDDDRDHRAEERAEQGAERECRTMDRRRLS